jgi:hypothetical protein
VKCHTGAAVGKMGAVKSDDKVDAISDLVGEFMDSATGLEEQDAVVDVIAQTELEVAKLVTDDAGSDA